MKLKSTIEIVLFIVAFIAIALLADAWRSSRHDTTQLNAALATQNAAMQQVDAHEKQRDTQLAATLAAISKQERAVQTPQQAAQAIPSLLPPLPLPVSIEIPALTAPLEPGQAPPPASMSIPQSDLKPLYDDLQNCRASELQNADARKDLSDEKARSASLTHERDTALAAAKGGSFWVRLKRSAKWFAIGLATGAAAAAMARR